MWVSSLRMMERSIALSKTESDAREFMDMLYMSHRKEIFRLCYGYLKHVQDADEAAQDTFLKAFSKLDTYRGDAPPIVWLRKIAVRVCLDRLRSFSFKVFRKGDELPDLSNPASQEHDLIRSETRERLEKGIASLSSMQRMVFVLRFYEEFTIQEIAETMDLHPGTVKRHLYRAVDRLTQTGGS